MLGKVLCYTMEQSKQISQETFDAVVRENIEEFEMDLHEAVQDAIEQFKTQGVDMSNLITSYVKDSDTGELKHSNPVKGEATFDCFVTKVTSNSDFPKKNREVAYVYYTSMTTKNLFFSDFIWTRHLSALKVNTHPGLYGSGMSASFPTRNCHENSWRIFIAGDRYKLYVHTGLVSNG